MSEIIKETKKDTQKQFILSENLWKIMISLSWPAILAMVLYGLNSVLDVLFVSYFVGETAVAGVSVAFPLTQISTGLGSLIGVGAGAVLSIALGRKDSKTQLKLLGNVNYISIITTILYMILGLIFSNQLVYLIGGKGEALSLGDSYFRITIYGSFFWIYGLAANMIIRAEGKMKSAAVMMGIGLIVNVIANYILMGIFSMGVEGSAWGTNLAMFVYTLVGWIYFGKGYASFKSKVFSIRNDKSTCKSIIGLGMSSLIMTVMTVVQAIFGLMRALQPVIGINFGAKQYERVISSYKIFAIASMALTLPFWIISMVSPNSILGLIISNASFTSTQLLYFRIYMAILPLLSILFMAMTLFPSVDKGKPAAIIGIVRQVIFYIPAMIILPKIIGISGIYYGSFAIDLIILLITVVMVKFEFNNLRKKANSDISYSC